MKILPHSSKGPLVNNVSCGLETTGDLCLNYGAGAASRGAEAAVRLDVCGMELTSSDSPEGERCLRLFILWG